MIQLVQQAISNNSVAQTSYTLTLPQIPKPGNMLVIGTELNDNTGPTAALTGVVFTRNIYFVGDASHDNCALWTGVVGSSVASAVVTVTHGASATYAAWIGEFSGVQQTVDGTVPTPTNLSTATPAITTNTVSFPANLVVAFMGHRSATSPTVSPSGWNIATQSIATATLGIETAWKIAPATKVAQTATWTFAGSEFALANIVQLKQLYIQTNNYQSVKAASGISVGERIR